MIQEPDVSMHREQQPSVEDVLGHGHISVIGRILNSSNATFLVEVTHCDVLHRAVYKPEQGERPLWDFDPGLYRREVAAYLVSEALGWHIVPTTIVRDDGPLGIGSLQLFIEHDPAENFFTLMEHHPATHEQLRRMAVFDLVVNNADRKAGHVLYDQQQRLWGIDHGLCFAEQHKLRTVMWDFAGEEIASELLDDITPLTEDVPKVFEAHLTDPEIEALQDRIHTLLSARRYPNDPTGRRFPWPLV